MQVLTINSSTNEFMPPGLSTKRKTEKANPFLETIRVSLEILPRFKIINQSMIKVDQPENLSLNNK